MLDPFLAWVRGVHDRYARVILAGIAALLLPLMILTTLSTVDNWRQDRERDELLECFDEFAALSSASSVAVREAAAAKDIATAARDTTLNEEGLAFRKLTRKILAQTVSADDIKRLDEALAARARAGRALERAQADLDQAREDNPIPPAPSKFCAVD